MTGASQEGDPMAALASVWASIGERTEDYVSVWRNAIESNGKGEYAAEKLLVDLQSLWGMSIGDAARFGAAVVDALGPLVAGFEPAKQGPEPEPAPSDPTVPDDGSS
jgi:hypothetical protein